MLKPHDLPFTQAYGMQARAFGPDLAFLDGDLPGAADIRRAHSIKSKKGQPLCLFEPGLSMLVVSLQARSELAALTLGLKGLQTPARVLLCPEESATRLIKSLETAQGTSFTFQRRKKLLFLEKPVPPPSPAPSPAAVPLPPGRMRQATLGDAEAIAAMIEKQEGELLDPLALAQALAGSGRAYLWECEGPGDGPVAVAVAVAALGCEDDTSVDINTVNTKPAARGKGFAFALLQGLIAQTVHPKAACVLVDEGNAPAQALYKKLGFRFACAWRYAEAGG